MKLTTITESITISYYDDYDNSNIGELCYKIAKESDIYISREKELTLVAFANEQPVGAVWSSFTRDDEYSTQFDKDIYRFDFDIAVAHNARATGMTSSKIGPKLIEAALKHYRSLRHEVDGSYIRVWVVNKKLAKYLENKYGFETDGREWSIDSPFLNYYGN